MPPRVVVLGGGVGGVVAARIVAEEARRHGVPVEVVMVTRDRRHFMPPLFFDVAIGEVGPEETYVALDGFARHYGVELVVDEAVGIDAGERVVRLRRGGQLSYDYLVVALGTAMEWSRYPGLAEAGVHNYSLEAALEMRRALSRFRGGRVLVLIPETPYRCGIYPYEAATVLASSFRNAGVKAEVAIMGPGAMPFRRVGRDVFRVVKSVLDELGVEYIGFKGGLEVDAERRVVRAGNVEERFDLLVKVPPPGLPEPLRRSEGFTWDRDPRFAPARAPSFRHPEYDEVYMVGEHSMPPAGFSLAGSFVHNAAAIAARDLVAQLVGFQPRGEPPAIMCAAYLADKAIMGACEARYDPEKQVYDWAGKCYLTAHSPLARLAKLGFYKSWLDQLRLH